MISLSKIDMAEATRLTREGRLEEAMTLLRSGPNPAARMRPASTASLRLPQRTSRLPSLGGVKARGATPVIPAGARYEERTFSGKTGSLSYKLYTPASIAGAPAPLVVMLHGCTQSPDDFALGTRMNEVAEEHGFLVAYPAQTQAANMSKCWNWFRPGDQRREGGEPSLIAGATRQMIDEGAIDPARVYIAGLSAGGAAAAIMGTAYPDLYAAVGVHSGLACGAARDMPSALSAMRQGAPTPGEASRVPAIVFHGDRDGTVHPVNGDQVVAQSTAAAGLASRTSRGQSGGMDYTQTIYADADGRAVLEQWLLHGAGHAWSGGSEAGSYADPRGPDASREMARFFLAHRRG